MQETNPKTLHQKIRRVLESRHAVDQGVLLSDLMDVIGGPRVLAKTMWEEYQRAPAGGLARQKFLFMVQSLIISTTASNLTKIIKPETLTDEDLQDMIEERLKRISDGSMVAPTPAADAPDPA